MTVVVTQNHGSITLHNFLLLSNMSIDFHAETEPSTLCRTSQFEAEDVYELLETQLAPTSGGAPLGDPRITRRISERVTASW